MSDNTFDYPGKNYDTLPFYEYAPPMLRRAEQQAGPQPGPYAQQPAPQAYWQPPSPPPSVSWPALGSAPLPVSHPTPQPPSQTPRKPRKLLLYGIGGVLCAIILLFVGSYALYARLAPPASSGKLSPTPQLTAGSPPAVFSNAACPFKPGTGIIEGQQLRCGYLTVPEDRSNPHSRTIKLAVAIFTPPGAVPADPMVYLSGGPGGALLNGWATYITSSNLAEFTQGHTLVMLDQRGTGFSQPALNCPEFTNAPYVELETNLSRTANDALYVQAGKQCHDRLVKSGINLNAYTTIADATDVHDLIHALGYKQVDLYGVSYGTRLALTVTRLFPSDLRSVILDSTLPTQENLLNDTSAVTQHAYDTLFHGCAISPQCHSKYPQLESVFYKLVNDLNVKPVTFNDAQYGPVTMNGDNLASWVFGTLYVTDLIPILPAAITQVSKGNYTLISQYYGAMMSGSDMSYGMYYSVECGEDVAFTTLQGLAQSISVQHPELRPSMLSELTNDFAVCQDWGDQPVPAVQKQPVVSSIPTLILSGQYDPITPYSNAKLAQQTLSHSFLFSFPGTGHGVFLTAHCPDSIVSAFLQVPTTQPDGSCISAMQEPHFQ